MKLVKVLFCAVVLLVGCAVWGQDYPKLEASIDYSFARYNPSAAYDLNGHSLNGGGGSIVYNFTHLIGFKFDLQGYGSNTSHFVIPASSTFPSGATANVQGNLFTYMLGPQIKYHGKIQPFAEALAGGAHSNVYGNAYKVICQPAAGACAFSNSPSANGFAFAIGGGLDIPITKTIQFRPGEFDYLLTNFRNKFNNTSQNNFRYVAGLNFTF